MVYSYDALIILVSFPVPHGKLLASLIADKFSFPDQSLFGRYFKAHTGTSPAKFRGQE